MATVTNAELLSMSGLRNPYPGQLGVVEKCALADVILIDGNPLTDISLIAEAETSMVVIMKEGEIFKNLVTAG